MKASKSPVVTNFTGTLPVDGKLNLGEETVVVLRVECTDSPRTKRQGKTKVWKQTGTIMSGIVLPENDPLTNQLLEMIADAMPSDEEQLPLTEVDDDEVEI